jgi:hypothetical protein
LQRTEWWRQGYNATFCRRFVPPTIPQAIAGLGFREPWEFARLLMRRRPVEGRSSVWLPHVRPEILGGEFPPFHAAPKESARSCYLP